MSASTFAPLSDRDFDRLCDLLDSVPDNAAMTIEEMEPLGVSGVAHDHRRLDDADLLHRGGDLRIFHGLFDPLTYLAQRFDLRQGDAQTRRFKRDLQLSRAAAQICAASSGIRCARFAGTLSRPCSSSSK